MSLHQENTADEAEAVSSPEEPQAGAQVETDAGNAPEIQASSPEEESASDIVDLSPQKFQELQDQYVRLAADFDNYRKRMQQEQLNLRKYGAENVMVEMLTVLDNLDRAGKSLTESSDPKTLFQSFQLLHNQLNSSLANHGFQQIKTAGEAFDPVYHEAVTQVETSDHPEGNVVEELQAGFMLHDRVLRPAMVSVAVAKTASSSDTTPESDISSNPFANTQKDSGFSAEVDA
ncbi:MAG: nucleotide exchange factor GrpE [Vampirovibrio sp.]|nr:nucleotide exchange factor GrpE [Vampirovibrio sp.]